MTKRLCFGIGVAAAILLTFLIAPFAQAETEKKEIVFGLISTETAENVREQWEPVLVDMEKSLGIPVKAFFAPDYAGVIEAMRFGKVDIAWYGKKAAIEAVDRAHGEVFAQVVSADGYPGYHSVLIVHRESPIKTFNDVLNSPGQYNFGNGDPNSTSGFLVPGYFAFAKNGIDPQKHFKRVLNSNHEFNALAVANGQLDIATNNTTMVGDPARNPREGRLWQTHPDLAAKLRVIWTSPLIPHEPLVMRKDLPEALKSHIRGFFYAYGKTDPQRQNLERIGTGIGAFKPSDNRQLDVIRDIEKDSTTLLQKSVP